VHEQVGWAPRQNSLLCDQVFTLSATILQLGSYARNNEWRTKYIFIQPPSSGGKRRSKVKPDVFFVDRASFLVHDARSVILHCGCRN
jgi:hypothetical protein